MLRGHGAVLVGGGALEQPASGGELVSANPGARLSAQVRWTVSQAARGGSGLAGLGIGERAVRAVTASRQRFSSIRHVGACGGNSPLPCRCASQTHNA